MLQLPSEIVTLNSFELLFNATVVGLAMFAGPIISEVGVQLYAYALTGVEPIVVVGLDEQIKMSDPASQTGNGLMVIVTLSVELHCPSVVVRV